MAGLFLLVLMGKVRKASQACEFLIIQGQSYLLGITWLILISLNGLVLPKKSLPAIKLSK
ncbi:hypothetical protein BOP93_00770 [Pseudomonas orientalis]|uniref:Uncharacterized protein n=1 Tax=Pseudomonas orientalis TaxID=76758 RepID=A0A2L0RPV6_9PSED|nr:hypothetical protein BOP93_00770 [Pseudomonas orientalis]